MALTVPYVPDSLGSDCMSRAVGPGRFRSILKLTCCVRGTHPPTSERKTIRCHIRSVRNPAAAERPRNRFDVLTDLAHTRIYQVQYLLIYVYSR